jgi:hypothetical protein
MAANFIGRAIWGQRRRRFKQNAPDRRAENVKVFAILAKCWLRKTFHLPIFAVNVRGQARPEERVNFYEQQR